VHNAQATSWAQAGLDVSANGFANFLTHYTLSPHTELTLSWLAEVDTTISSANRGFAETHPRATMWLAGLAFAGAARRRYRASA
jgi:hypothetical protein